MKILDMIKMCLQNLTRRKSRTILTVLGVVVGCCAIVTMMSIGFGVQNSQQIMLEGMGDLTLIQVYSEPNVIGDLSGYLSGTEKNDAKLESAMDTLTSVTKMVIMA